MIEIDQTIRKSFLKETSTDENVQRLTIRTSGELTVVVVIPHSVFEWFVEIFDHQNNKILTDWVDHYGDSPANLQGEMKAALEKFIQITAQCPLRIVRHEKPERSKLQVYYNEAWTEDIW